MPVALQHIRFTFPRISHLRKAMKLMERCATPNPDESGRSRKWEESLAMIVWQNEWSLNMVSQWSALLHVTISEEGLPSLSCYSPSFFENIFFLWVWFEVLICGHLWIPQWHCQGCANTIWFVVNMLNTGSLSSARVITVCLRVDSCEEWRMVLCSRSQGLNLVWHWGPALREYSWLNTVCVDLLALSLSTL